MIDSQTVRSDATRRMWARHAQSMFNQARIDEEHSVEDVSEALGAFCEQYPHMATHTLPLLIARSFCATGNRTAAEQVLANDRIHRRHAQSWLDALSAEYPFPELYPLFNSRVLRPLNLQTVGTQSVWVLDLEKIHASDADQHEMILMQALRVLAEKISNVWKKTDGQGALVVKGLSRMTLAACPVQIVGYLQDVLRNCATLAGLTSVPSVLLLDL